MSTGLTEGYCDCPCFVFRSKRDRVSFIRHDPYLGAFLQRLVAVDYI